MRVEVGWNTGGGPMKEACESGRKGGRRPTERGRGTVRNRPVFHLPEANALLTRHDPRSYVPSGAQLHNRQPHPLGSALRLG